jgi:hypothetical protein
VYRLLRAAGERVGSALRALGHAIVRALRRPVDAATAWGGRQLTRLRWLLLGAGAGWVAAATGYGVLAAGVGVLFSVVPGLAALIFAWWPELRGRAPVAWVRDVAKSWYELRLPWQVGAGLLVGVALWAFVGGGDPAAAAMAAAAPFGGPNRGSSSGGRVTTRPMRPGEHDAVVAVLKQHLPDRGGAGLGPRCCGGASTATAAPGASSSAIPEHVVIEVIGGRLIAVRAPDHLPRKRGLSPGSEIGGPR